MPQSVIGLQIRPGRAVAVRVRGGWRGAVVEAVISPGPSPDDAAEGGGSPPLPDLPAGPVVTGLPADRLFGRTVEVPFRDRSKAAQAAPLEAEDTLPVALEDLVYDVHVLERTPTGCRVVLAAALRRHADALMGVLEGAGIRPAALDAEPFALANVAHAAGVAPCVVCDLSPDLVQAVWVGPSGPVRFQALSAAGAGADVLDELARLLDVYPPAAQGRGRLFLAGASAHEVDAEVWEARLGTAVALLPFPPGLTGPRGAPDPPWPAWAVPLGFGLREVRRRTPARLNLLVGPHGAAGEWAWKPLAVRVAIYGVICLALWGAGVAARLAYLRTQYDHLRSAVRQVFRETLPDVTHVVSEVDQMRARVQALEERARSLGSLVDREVSPLRILREISARIPKDLEVEFRDFQVEEGRVRIEGVTTSFDAIDRIKAELATYPRFAEVAVSDAKTMAEKEKVLFKLAVALGKEP